MSAEWTPERDAALASRLERLAAAEVPVWRHIGSALRALLVPVATADLCEHALEDLRDLRAAWKAAEDEECEHRGYADRATEQIEALIAERDAALARAERAEALLSDACSLLDSATHHLRHEPSPRGDIADLRKRAGVADAG